MRGGPESAGGVAGNIAAPVLEVTCGVLGDDAVVDIENMSLAVAVDYVEGRHLQPLERGLELGEVRRLAHVPILLQHARAVEAGHAQRDGLAIWLDKNRTLHGRADGDGLVLDGAVVLLDPEGPVGCREGEHLTVIQVPARRKSQLIRRVADDLVDRVRKSKLIVEAEAQHGQPDLRGTVHVDARSFELRLIVGQLPWGPGQVGVRQQQRVVARGFGRRKRPRVRAARDAARAERTLLRGHVAVVRQAVRVRNDIHAGDGQHHLHGRIDRLRMLGRIVIDALRERVHIEPELWRLLFVPLCAALVGAVDDDPFVGIHKALAKVFRGAPAGLAIKVEEEVAVALRLRVAEAVEDASLALAVDVRNAIGVPQDLSMRVSLRERRRRGKGHASSSQRAKHVPNGSHSITSGRVVLCYPLLLKRDSQGKLDFARVFRRGDAAEGGRVRGGVGRIEVGMIQDIEELGAELNGSLSWQRKTAGKRRIEVLITGLEDRVARRIAEGTGRSLRQVSRRVEVLRHRFRPVVRVAGDVRPVAIGVGVADVAGVDRALVMSGLSLVDLVDLKAAQHLRAQP